MKIHKKLKKRFTKTSIAINELIDGSGKKFLKRASSSDIVKYIQNFGYNIEMYYKPYDKDRLNETPFIIIDIMEGTCYLSYKDKLIAYVNNSDNTYVEFAKPMSYKSTIESNSKHWAVTNINKVDKENNDKDERVGSNYERTRKIICDLIPIMEYLKTSIKEQITPSMTALEKVVNDSYLLQVGNAVNGLKFILTEIKANKERVKENVKTKEKQIIINTKEAYTTLTTGLKKVVDLEPLFSFSIMELMNDIESLKHFKEIFRRGGLFYNREESNIFMDEIIMLDHIIESDADLIFIVTYKDVDIASKYSSLIQVLAVDEKGNQVIVQSNNVEKNITITEFKDMIYPHGSILTFTKNEK